ncbi:innexin unc-9-like isoform X2 [Argopecten irradians]|uniref:innexin unc-9-like isoform X2 n=1 Tax=Argopecten irradians TaxID=31199 RepID=UPI00371E1FD1
MGDGVSEVLGFVPSLNKLRGSTSDDWIDRISHMYTVIMLVIFAIVVSSGQFFGDPIHCWCPAEFTDAFEEYTKYVCWISNTYYIPMKDSIPDEDEIRQEKELTYYQWIPLILLLQAFLFKIPNIAWRMLNTQAGINIDKIVRLAEETQEGSPEDRMETIENLAKYMDKWLGTYQEYKRNIIVRVRAQMTKVMCCLMNRRAGTFLTGLYMIIKIVYVVNVISQFFILNAFMATDYNMYGFQYIESLINNEPVRENPRFPRVTLCDFRIRQLQNVQPWTVQCVLPINLFNEKIFIFLWFWFVLVATLACFSLLKTAIYHIFKQNKVRYVKKYLKISNEIHSNYDKKLCAQFAEGYLRNDGIFVLYMIAKNSTDLVVVDLMRELWKIFKAKHSPNNNVMNNHAGIEDTNDMAPPLDEKEPLTDGAYQPQ